MTDELDLCDVEDILSNKDQLLTTGKLLGVEAITCNEIPNKGLNKADREMEGRKLMRDKQIFKEYQENNVG